VSQRTAPPLVAVHTSPAPGNTALTSLPLVNVVQSALLVGRVAYRGVGSVAPGVVAGGFFLGVVVAVEVGVGVAAVGWQAAGTIKHNTDSTTIAAINILLIL
jgi:hypothetical protein